MGSMSYIQWIIFAVIAYGVYRMFVRGKGPAKYCKTCGTTGPTTTRTRGSIWIEIVLWLCFIVPGLIYSLWRLTTKQQVCGACESTEIVPVDSPVAVAARQQLGAKL